MSLIRAQRAVRNLGGFAGGTSRLARTPTVLEEPDVRPGAAGTFVTSWDGLPTPPLSDTGPPVATPDGHRLFPVTPGTGSEGSGLVVTGAGRVTFPGDVSITFVSAFVEADDDVYVQAWIYHLSPEVEVDRQFDGPSMTPTVILGPQDAYVDGLGVLIELYNDTGSGVVVTGGELQIGWSR